jgi:hypothetical protein
MRQLKKFAITSTICGVILFISSGFVLADNWMNARSIGNKAKALSPELVISDKDETDVLEVTNSFSGDFVLGSGEYLYMDFIKVKNLTGNNSRFAFDSFFESTNRPLDEKDPYAPSKLYNRLHISIYEEGNGNPVFSGYLKDLDFDHMGSILLTPYNERVFYLQGIIKDLDVSLAGEELTYGVGIIAYN